MIVMAMAGIAICIAVALCAGWCRPNVGLFLAIFVFLSPGVILGSARLLRWYRDGQER
ncbi:hypothetical protein ACTXG6_40345 [Pseudonocardia sp. Cha107L01]|uniref:hypothetical protein n=1 Tax=Pseudonocardia sp. Cha107L01 TaxID=3457576 RepID=UPI00403E4E7C